MGVGSSATHDIDRVIIHILAGTLKEGIVE